MIKNYVCNFSNGDQIVFDIFQNELTEVWSEVVKNTINAGGGKPAGIHCALGEHGYSRQECYDVITQSIQIVRTITPNFGIGWPSTVERITQDCLNCLHEEFQTHVELGKNIGVVGQALNNVNRFIHTLEVMLNQQSQGYVVWDLEGSNKFAVTITDSTRKHFISIPKSRLFGSLTLGYATIGKDLEAAYYNNDVELVRAEGLRQQEFITSEVVFLLREKIFKPHELELIKIKKWIYDNNLEKHIDISDPKYYYMQRPIIGQIKGNDSMKKIANIWNTSEFTHITID